MNSLSFKYSGSSQNETKSHRLVAFPWLISSFVIFPCFFWAWSVFFFPFLFTAVRAAIEWILNVITNTIVNFSSGYLSLFGKNIERLVFGLLSVSVFVVLSYLEDTAHLCNSQLHHLIIGTCSLSLSLLLVWCERELHAV